MNMLGYAEFAFPRSFLEIDPVTSNLVPNSLVHRRSPTLRWVCRARENGAGQLPLSHPSRSSSDDMPTMARSRVSGSGRFASSSATSQGNDNTYCRTGTAGNTRLIRCAEVFTIRRAPHDLRKPRHLQVKATGVHTGSCRTFCSRHCVAALAGVPRSDNFNMALDGH